MARHDRRLWRLALLALLPALAAACGGDSTPITPTPTTYTLTVQVRGDQSQQLVSGAMVRITDGSNAGRNATSDQAGNATLTGLSAGNFNLEITASGYGTTTQPVALTTNQTVTVQMRLTPNTLPVITSIVAKGSYPNEPANYVDASETATVTVSVTDPETPADKMTFEWRADVGSFTGTTTGPTVTWQPPGNVGGSGPTSVTFTVTAVEKYGPGNTLENRVTSNAKAALHDGKKESGEVCSLFLNDFSNSTMAAADVVRNFSGSLCPAGKAEELQQITDNRRNYKITYSAIGTPTVSLNFGGACFSTLQGDACVRMTCEWRSTIINPSDPNYGKSEHVAGTCNLTTVYDRERDAWKLCWSTFDGKTLPSGKPATNWIF